MVSISNISTDKEHHQERQVSGLYDGKATVPNCSKCHILKPPSTACKFGHFLCFECGYASNNCPCEGEDGTICGKDWDRIDEHVLEMCYHSFETNAFPCRNNWVGCSSVMMGGALDPHEESECQFSPVKRCPLTPCPKRNIHVSKYMEHLKKDHPYVKVMKTNDHCLISKNFMHTKAHVTRSTRAMSCLGGEFLTIIHDYDDRISFWIHVITKPSDKNFKATIKIPYYRREPKPNGKDGEIYMKHHEIVNTHNVHSLNKSYEQILEEGECIDMKKDTFQFPPGMLTCLRMQPIIIEYIIEEVISQDVMEANPLDLMGAISL